MLSDQFIRGSALLTAAMMVGNVFGYLFQLSMGRMLSVEAYGAMNALMSLMVIFGIPLMTLVNFFARETVGHFSRGDQGIVRGLHRFGIFRICWIGGPFLLAFGLFSPVLAQYLRVPFELIVLVLAVVFVTALTAVNTGIIQGMQSFRALAFIGAGTSGFKFAFGVLFVWFGWGVYGALGGLLATGLTLFGFSRWVLRTNLPRKTQPFAVSFSEISGYVGGLFLANTFFGVMTQADVILVKHYFTAQEAGIYASAAIMGKAVMYLPGALVLALFPMVVANQAMGRSSLGMLLKAMGLTFGLSGAGTLILYLFPEIVMGVLFGERYLPAAPLTALFGLAMLPMAGILVLMNYLLAQGKTRFVGLLAAGALLELAGIHFFRTDLASILHVILIAGTAAFLSMALLALRPGIGKRTKTFTQSCQSCLITRRQGTKT